MQKATREAKLRNSWINPNQEYEASINHFIDGLLMSEPFLTDFLPFQKRISSLGILNSLSQTVLRLTAPGIPDTYQGTELWDLSLVDPDNRRPLNFDRRREMLASLSADNVTATMEDGRIKLWITRQLLHCRRRFADLFLQGSYNPIYPTGDRAKHLFAFTRTLDDQVAIILVPRLVASLQTNGWGDTRIPSPPEFAGREFENIFTGGRIILDGDILPPMILRDFPVAVLLSQN
jgi:(1->4)-alpha-D-glucan 1-alpha-D-glucosylmutase